MVDNPTFRYHVPVMLQEVLEHLQPAAGDCIIDATAGTGGHSEAIAEKIGPTGKLISIDRDEDALAIARQRLGRFGSAVECVYGNFHDIDTLLAARGVSQADGILFDLGVSSMQLETPDRGFSFQNDGPLDMRLDKNSYISAYDLINNLNEEEISALLREFGQERWHNRIARALVQERQIRPITTTAQLAEIIKRSIPYKFRYGKIHPATRTFQAVRIAVNRELETLEKALDKAVAILKPTARICVISFHSLEDRIVKFRFRQYSHSGLIDIITPKPLTPSDEEVNGNPRSRSSKMRVAERLEQ
jgi:16S rRNA (cytosine1402-N4)-methyltransferase